MKPGNRRRRIGAKSCRPERSERWCFQDLRAGGFLLDRL